jgi:hypothetical protein
MTSNSVPNFGIVTEGDNKTFLQELAAFRAARKAREP